MITAREGEEIIGFCFFLWAAESKRKQERLVPFSKKKGVSLLLEGKEFSCFFPLLFLLLDQDKERKKVLGSFFFLVFKREVTKRLAGKVTKKEEGAFSF